MDQPIHDLRPFQTTQATPRRFVSIAIVVAIHAVAIWAFATGLAQRLIHQGEQIIKVEVVKEKPPAQPKTPPPPPPELQKPPPPFVPPPDINLQTEAPTTAIRQIVNTPPPAPTPTKPAPPAITAPASVGKAHECNSKYPPLAVRLNHQGKVTIGMTIEPDGSVTNVHVTGPSGFEELDNGAVSCASSWRYKPAMQNGQPVAVPWQATVQYKLTG